jgi:hypothetical protein
VGEEGKGFERSNSLACGQNNHPDAHENGTTMRMALPVFDKKERKGKKKKKNPAHTVSTRRREEFWFASNPLFRSAPISREPQLQRDTGDTSSRDWRNE